MQGCKWDVSTLWTKCVIMVVFCFWCTGFGAVAWGDIISGCTYGEWVTKVWTFSCLIEYAVTVMLSSIFESRVVLKYYELKPLAKMLIIHWREPILFSILRFCVKFSLFWLWLLRVMNLQCSTSKDCGSGTFKYGKYPAYLAILTPSSPEGINIIVLSLMQLWISLYNWKWSLTFFYVWLIIFYNFFLTGTWTRKPISRNRLKNLMLL